MKILVDEAAANKLTELEQRELSLARQMLELIRDRKELLEAGLRAIAGGKIERVK